MGKFGYLNYENSENQITHANNDDFDEFLESTIMEGAKKRKFIKMAIILLHFF